MQTTSLSCQELVELVTDYLEAVLAPGVRVVCEGHLAGCSLCRAYLEQMRQTLRVLGTLADEPASPTARDGLIAAFRAWQDGRPRGPVP